MPYSDGRIYARIIDGKKVGISTHEVAACLGVTSLDVGTLCRSPKINWKSRYRPVPYDTPPPANIPDIMDRSQQLQGKYWDETVYVVRPWFYGRFGDDNNTAIVAPSLDDNFDNIISTNGVVTTSKRWKGNLPPVGTYAHLDQFHGYNERAELPWYGYVSGGVDKETGTEISRKDGKLRIGFQFTTNDNDELVGMRDGCWSAKELFTVLGFNTQIIYVNIAIRNNGATVITPTNRRHKYVSGTVGEIDLRHVDMSDFDPEELGFYITLDLNNASNLEYGGIGQVLQNNDVLDVIVYLTDAFNSTSYSSNIGGRSLFIDDESHAYKRFKVVETAAETNHIFVNYTWNVPNNLSIATGDYDDVTSVVYMRSGDYIYRVWGFQSGVSAGGITVATTDYAALSGSRKTRVRIGIRCDFSQDGGNYMNFDAFTFQRDVSASEWQSTQSFTWTPNSGFTVYNSAADAASGNNPHDLEGYVKSGYSGGFVPLIDAVAEIDSSGNVGGFYEHDPEISLHVDCDPQWPPEVTVEEIRHYIGKATYINSNKGLIQIY